MNNLIVYLLPSIIGIKIYEVLTTKPKVMSTYHIERKFYQSDRPYWIDQILLSLRPRTFDKTDNINRVKENLKEIGQTLQKARCIHYGKNRLLCEIRNIIQSDNSITVTSFGNKKYMAFNIVEI